MYLKFSLDQLKEYITKNTMTNIYSLFYESTIS